METSGAPLKANYDCMVKIKMLGDSAVGKSSIIMRFCTDEFSDEIAPTIGVDYRSKTCMIDDNMVKVVIWDTAGQERFRTITKNYYRGS
jgi:small GTP-binding protein